MERKSVLQAIAHWASHEPQRVAVNDNGVCTSYADFWQRVQSTAAALQALGCGREDCVAVYAARSTDAIVAIYAALACGSAFVPVDPTAGRQRIRYILENCQAKAILTAGETPESDLPILDVRGLPEASFCPAERLPGDLAYVIYTSGTTGVPKGVMIEEHSLLNHLDTLYEHYGCCLGQKVPLMTSHCFDFSMPMVFSLYFGMTLLLFPDAVSVGEYLAKEHLDYLRMTPSHFMAAADMLKRTAYGKVDKMIFGGEALTDAMCNKVREVFGEQVRIYNEYGPTETTVYTTFIELEKGQRTSIGHPCAGSTVYILDEDRLCAPHEIGELCFAGPNLARGYFADAEKTADRFREYHGVRLYHTGDLGYMDEDGILYYAGRRDKQIKIRGFRVEPEEIAGVLRNQANVTDAVVIAVKAANGDPQLHAYLVGDGTLDLSAIREGVQEDLPSYMIPAAMLQIPKIPLTANGKLDERALPQIQQHRSHTPPRNDSEQRLCTLFGELLRIEAVGIDEDFFALGGNSLAAMRLLHRLTEEGCKLRLTDIFSHPTVQELAPLLQEPRENAAPIPIAPAQADYPLSPSQEQMYWFYRLDPNSLSYHMPWCLTLDEEVSPEDIQRAMQSMVDRHEILRTRFFMRDGIARQEVLPHLEVTLRVIREQTSLTDEVIQDFLKPFILETPPLFRFTMLKQESGWLLLTDMHHIIRDGLSCSIFLEEYTALREGRPLPHARLQYKDYCQWLEGRDLSAQGAFWLEQFQSLPQPLALPTDYARPAVRSYAGACVQQAVPSALRDQLRKLEAQTNTTDYMIFLAGAMLLLSQYARQEDIVIGSPLGGRSHDDLDRLLGIFINTLPMRAYPSADKTLAQFLQEIRTLCIGAYEHQEYPLATLVEACGAAREASRNPLYDVILVLQNREHMQYQIAGHEVKRLPLHQGCSKVDLTFQILESNDRFDVVLEYSTELFRRESAQRMLSHYMILLERMATGLALPLAQLLPLSDAERKKMAEQSDSAPHKHTLPTVSERFEAEAAKHPNLIAIRDGAREWSFAQLHEKVTRLASKLQAMGLQRGQFAVLLCDRSAEYLLGVMAVLHCGAAFVPVDPQYPQDRIAYILQDSNAALLLTDRADCSYAVPTVLLTEDICDAPIPLVQADKEDPAYMIYTSGTTGKPKGVMISHRALSHYIAYAGAHYRDTDAPLEVALFSSISFDLTITSTFLGLLYGGTTTVYAQSPDEALAQILREDRTTFLKLTPSHLKMMEELPYTGKGRLRHMILGGEVLPTALAKRAQARYGAQLTIHNEYGPTEATVGCCDYCYDAQRDRDDAVSIGRPMDHVQIYIMRESQLCPIRMPGELCIAGSSIASGYRNQKPLTDRVFVPNPFGEGLLYRSGDLARLCEDGRIDFMGRIDDQVKIRGYRIEPQEVTQVLSSLPEVHAAHVAAWQTDDGEAYLCGYVVSNKTLEMSALKAALSKELPAYMIPQHLLQISSIPLTVNGKVDTAALPRPQRQEQHREPETAEELLVCRLVSELLGVETVDPEEDFFALGGNSLKLMSLRLRLERQTGKNVSLTELYRKPKLNDIAQHLSESAESAQWITPAPKQERYPMSAVQQRLYAIYLADPDTLAYNHPMGIHICGDLDAARLEGAFAALLQRHEALRTRFDGKFQYIEEIPFSLPRMSCPNGDVQALLEAFATPFCLESAPLLRAQLIELGQAQWLLLMDVHHIAADGISKSLLMQELCALYRGQTLSPIALQYKDYSHWLSQHNAPKASAFWQEMCGGEPTELIYNKTNSKTLRRTAATCSLSLDFAQSNALRQLCAEHSVTPYMFFLAVWSHLLGIYTRSEDVTVGSSFAGRSHPNLEQTVGMFVHTLLLRAHPVGRLPFLSYLQEVKELCRQAQAHQEEGEDALREALSTCKLFYAFEDVPEMEFALPKASCTLLRPCGEEIPFDITFLVEDRDCYCLKLQYCTDLFFAHTAESILEHLQHTLASILQQPTCALEDLPLVTPQEQTLLAHFNATEAEFDHETSIADIFERIAASFSERTALVFGQEQLSYRELNERANGVAHWLQERGIGKNDFVALLCQNSIERMVALWGVIKSGAAYVPIEPDFPIERIRSIIDDCQPRAILLFGAELQSKIAVLDMAEAPMARRDNPLREQAQVDPLYCIYTSGTTGKPKGVVLSNRGLVSLVNYYKRRLGFTEHDRVLQFAGYCFDASVSEMLMALAFGATLVLTPDALRHDSRGLREYCVAHRVSVATFPPNLYAQIEPFPARLILTAGSAADPATVLRGSQKGAYLNAYGPTEASICATDWLYTPDTPIPDRVPIGKPIDNVKIYILQGTRLCGVGIPGELCIAGESLALQYLHRPELTAEKFIDDPFGSGKLYRTGDLARWLPDGNIDYLGRIDEQVKLRGFRIELQEIETCLLSLPQMKQAAVRLVTPEGQMPLLCAYYVSDAAYSEDVLRAHLGQRLPGYMIPDAYVSMQTLPLNVGGKVDAKRLPMPTRSTQECYLPPLTAAQKTLCSIFEELLQVSPIGREDDFFLLGGQSLKAMLMMNHIEEAFGTRPSFADILTHPTPVALETLLQGESKRYQPIAHAPNANSYPASPVQARFYSIQKAQPDSIAYNVPFCFRLEGDYSRLEAVLNELFASHEALRTAFAIENGQVVQKIAAHTPITLPERELAQDECIEDALRAFVRPFCMEQAPLARCCVLRKGEETWLLMDLHHSIIDGVSTRLLTHQIDALLNGKQLEAPRQYRDYSLWDAQQDRSLQKDFWESALSGELPQILLPYQAQGESSARSAICKERIEPTLTQAIRDLARTSGATEYMLLLAAVSIVLARYSRTEDVTVGTPAANRLHPDTAQMVGMFVNTLLLRARPKAELCFREFLQEFKQFALKALEYQDYPFDAVVDHLRSRGVYDEAHFLPVMFSMEETGTLRFGNAQLRAEAMALSSGEGKFDLSIEVLSQSDSYLFSIDYRCDRLSEESIHRFFGHVTQVLQSVTANPDIKLAEIDLLQPAERSRILDIFNHTPQHETRSYLELYARQVERTPQATAVVYRERSLSYAALDRRADHLAWQLRKAGVQGGQIVAVFSRFDEDMFISALGIMKAGCAYLPIDPSYPKQRIAYMLQDSGASCVVCSEGIHADTALTQLCLAKTAVADVAPFPVQTDPRQLAYVIYTSGSTGLPKGVMVSQAALANMVQWHNRYYQIKPGDRSCKYASFSFDASVHEMFPQLAAGAQIHIIPEDIRMDMFAINRYFTEHHINVGFLPTPICEQFVLLENHSLEKLIAGGDRMTRHSKNYTLYNNYGPTENTVVSTVYEVQGSEKEIPIGKPIDGTRVYVLSKERQLQPIGITGEIALAGRSLAEGYLHKPELTAERFVPDPFFPGERMYLTGDLARWTQNGDLCYEGRLDNQFKIRGNRVEIGEIEAAANALPAIRQSLVRVMDGRLILYVAGEVEEAALREHLQQRLPKYMLPEAYVFVDALRYTVNSKPDFDAMPAPQFSKTKTTFAPAEDPIEEALVQIWSEVLQTSPIGREDNFFELGGNSLRITLLHYAIEAQYPGQLTVGDLFANPTVAATARALKQKLSAATALKPCLLTLPEGHGGSVTVSAKMPSSEATLLSALAYSLHRCGKCREVVIYWEAEEGFARCFRFDMQRLETASQLLTAALEQGGEPLTALPSSLTAQPRNAARQRSLSILLTPFANRKSADLVFAVQGNTVCLVDTQNQIAKTALQQLLQFFVKASGIFAAQKPDHYPLSSQQSRIYIAQSLMQEKNAYHIPMVFRLPASTDIPRLCAALKALVARYDIFRTSFCAEQGQLRQKVATEVDFSPVVRQCADFDPQQFAPGEPFDLEKAPLLRAELVQAKDAVYLLIETHHIIFDGASLPPLKQELLQLYRGETLAPVTLQYPAYCQWKTSMQEDEAYWTAHFAEGVFPLEMPTDKPRKKARSYRCGTEHLSLDAALARRLQHLASSQGTTEFCLLTAASHLLLSRYCGQLHSLLGTAMAGRTQARLQTVPGMFVNTVPLTAHIDPNETFAQLLSQVSQTMAEAEAHQSYPFAELLRLLHLESDSASNPLIHVCIAMDEPETGLYDPISLPSEVEKFDMTLRYRNGAEGASLELSYCLDLFCQETAQQLLESLHAILQGLDPNSPLKQLKCLSARQIALLQSYNQTDAQYDRSKTVCDLIDGFAQSEKPAVVFEGQHLSYRELLLQSQSIAGMLQEKALRSEEIVGILLPRGLEMYPAIYGVLKAGGAYLPMDPAYPDIRLQHMVRDSGLRYVLTCKALAPRLKGLCQTLLVEELPQAVYHPTQLVPTQLAYVIYTSGSSGLPKGVLVEHGSLMNMVLWHKRRFGNCAQDVSTQYAGLGFDAAVWEIFPYLAVGATIHVIPQRLRLDMPALNAYYEANGITISYLPTQICEQFMHLDNRSLRLLHTAGDKLKQFEKRNYVLMNNYGPTENTVVATTAEIRESSWNLPIGKPMDNCKVYVMDENGQLLPPGARGELCLSGQSVARGYLNREEETRQKFVPDPFGAGRMYKTGDLVRWNHAGELEFLGRNDHQVKIRGNRIECGEIEAVLSSLAQVTQCAVIAQQRENGEGYLLAYFCAEEAIDPNALKSALAQRLPDYMVPSALMQLSALPLTPNGKLDRAALPIPEQTQAHGILPTTAIQKELAALWRKLLNVEDISIDRSFFSLGGSSVLMISLQRAITEHFGKQISIAELFANPTIEKQESLLCTHGELTLRGLPLPQMPSTAGRVLRLPVHCAQALWRMGEEQAFSISLTAFCYVLSALSKRKQIPMQGRRGAELFAAVLDFDGITRFAEAIERCQNTKMQTLPLHSQGLQVEKQGTERVPLFVWNDREALPCDERADLIVRLCLSETEASLRADHPRDAALCAAVAQLLQQLCQTETEEGRTNHGL